MDIIAEALATLLEKTRARIEVDKALFKASNPKASTWAMPATLAEAERELARWEPK